MTRSSTGEERRLAGRQWIPSEAVAAKLAELEGKTNTLEVEVEVEEALIAEIQEVARG